jgi:UDP-3-O-[3-hydroxymyristoyl] glucosamine N-acyltransferase
VPETVLTAQAVADLVGGRLLGNGTTQLTRVGPLDRADATTLCFLVSTNYLAYFRASKAGAVLISPALVAEPEGPTTRIVVDDPYRAVLSLLPRFVPPPAVTTGVDPSAVIGEGVELGADVFIGPSVVIGAGARIGARSRLDARAVIGDGVVLGEDCRIGPGAVCYEGARLGHRVVLKANAVIAGRGFGYLPSASGHQPIPHVGACVLEDDVEVGSCSTVDRGSFDDTVIGQGTKIDNLVHVAHNCRVGRNCLIMATVGIAGSVKLGDQVMVLGGVGIADHVEVGSGAILSARSVVIGDVPPKATMGGYPARPHREFLRAQGALYRLAPIAKQLESLIPDHESRAKTND